MDIVILLALAAVIVLLVILIVMSINNKPQDMPDTKALTREIRQDINSSVSNMGALISDNMSGSLSQLEKRIATLESGNEQKLEQMRETISKRLTYIQEDNNKKLDEMRATVDERLQKSLEDKMNESFKTVSKQLEAVYLGLGEMKNIASGVGDLKKVLSNVKTRGILGEIQLGAILSEILTPDQYDTEVPTIPGSRERVEFAIKLPAKEDGGYIYLPIDSKFPGDIRSKYVAPPYTTNFGIMFLPFEGLYAEVINHGLVEKLQREYSINIAGPSTMAAMLNSLQMGFKTLQIQKRSNEVWELLSAVRSEFESFDKVFMSAKNRIRQLDEDMDKLIGTRSKAIKKQLDKVEQYRLEEK